MIRILPDHLINQIAAGEVIEKPASIIKELVENAIDAGASKIEIAIRNAGKSFISVSDNGCGMNQDDMKLAITRHATSKLSTETLNNISTFGFRGEALPSIASVSRMSITSNPTNDSANGWQIEIEAGKITADRPASCLKGTKFEVRDLFYAIPARLKFLRSDNYEALHVFEILSALILANPQIAFTFHDGQKQRFHLNNIHKPLFSDEFTIDFFQRMKILLGKEAKDNYVPIKQNYGTISLHGYIGLPTFTAGRANKQFFCINHRVVKDKLLTGALRGAFADVIPYGRYPVCVLFLQLPLSDIDVNVHPAKTEIRFQDPQKIRGFIVSAIKKTLLAEGGITAFERTNDLQNNFTQLSPNYQQYQFNPARQFNPGHQLDNEHQLNEQQNNFMQPAMRDVSEADASIAQNTDMIDYQTYPMGAAVAQLHGNYIIAQNETGFLIIDQHAAHERIIYEKLKKALSQQTVESQQLLVPEIISLSKEECDLLLANQDKLSDCGLEIASFGVNDIIVTSVPAMLKNPNFEDLFEKMLTEFYKLNENPLHEILERICATIACYGSIRSGRIMTLADMNSLLRTMEHTPNAGQCNHGRPTFIKMDLPQLEKLFERR